MDGFQTQRSYFFHLPRASLADEEFLVTTHTHLAMRVALSKGAPGAADASIWAQICYTALLRPF